MSIRTIQSICVITVIISLVGLASLYAWAIQEKDSALIELDKKMLEKVYLEEEIVHIEKMLSRFEKEKTEFNDYLFAERDIPAFIDEISKFAKVAGVEVKDMKTQRFHQVKVPNDSNLTRPSNSRRQAQSNAPAQKTAHEILTLAAMPIQVRLTGHFVDLAEFLNYLQDYQQLVNVSGVEIKRSQNYPDLDCQFLIRIYSLKSLEELGRR